MTKKEFNAIRHAAFMEFMKQRPDFGAYETITAVKITEGDKVEIWLIHYPTQVNKNTLAEKGFSPAATIETLFHADKKTKSLDFPSHRWSESIKQIRFQKAEEA